MAMDSGDRDPRSRCLSMSGSVALPRVGALPDDVDFWIALSKALRSAHRPAARAFFEVVSESRGLDVLYKTSEEVAVFQVKAHRGAGPTPRRKDSVPCIPWDDFNEPDDHLRFGDVASLTGPVTDLERRILDPGAIERRLLTSSTDAYGQDRRTVTSAAWWRATASGKGTYRQLLRRLAVYLRRRLGLTRTPVRTWDEEAQNTGMDHSCESHRSRAPGRLRTFVDLVRREPLAV